MRKFWLLCSSMVLGFSVGLLLPNVSGCWPFSSPGKTVIEDIKDKTPPPPEKKASTVAEAEKELADAKKAALAAEQKVKEKEQQLTDIRIAHERATLYWVMGWALLAALGCVAGAVYLTGVRKYFVYGFFTCIAVAALALCIAAILPYLIWIGVGLLVLGLLFALYCWRNDHKGLRQVATAVETFKDKMPGYKEHFSKVIDTDVDGWLNRTRKNLGLLAKK